MVKDSDDLRAYLAEAQGEDTPEKISDEVLRQWSDQELADTREANRRAVLIGRVLNARRPSKRSEVKAWQEERAAVLGRSPRTLRLYQTIARRVDSVATALPRGILDRPLREVSRAICNVEEGRSPDAAPPPKPPKPKPSKREAWAGHVEAVVRGMPGGKSNAALRRDALYAIMEAIDKAEGTDTLGPLLRAEGGKPDPGAIFAEAARRVVDTRSGPRPLRDRHRIGPVIPYAGGKYHVVVPIMDKIGPMGADGGWGNYVFREPFTGGGIVSLNMLESDRAKRVWINDLDPAVAALHTAVLHEPDAFKAAVPALDEITLDRVLEARARVEARSVEGVELARECLIKQRAAYQGMAERPMPRDIEALRKRWNTETIKQRITVAHGILRGRVEHDKCTSLDFSAVIAAPGMCFIYADPPYPGPGEDLYKFSFGPEQHEALRHALHATDQPWLLSYNDHPLVRDLYSDDIIKKMAVPKGRHKKGEAQYQEELLICSKSYRWILDPDPEPEFTISDLDFSNEVPDEPST